MRKLLIVVIMMLASMIVFGAEEVDMSKPIIDPGVWFEMQKADELRTLCFVFSFLLFFIAIIAITMHVALNDGFDDGAVKILVVFGTMLLVAVILIVVGYNTPSKDTLMKQMITSQVTPNNIEAAKKAGVEFVDYIIEKVKELK